MLDCRVKLSNTGDGSSFDDAHLRNLISRSYLAMRKNLVMHLCNSARTNSESSKNGAPSKSLTRALVEQAIGTTLRTICGFFLCILSMSGSAAAETWRVHSTADAIQKGTLRHAVLNAVNGDTIVLQVGLGKKHPILLSGSEILLDKNLTITSIGPQAATISAGSRSRVFRITDNAVVRLENIIITEGKSPEGSGQGGGIFNQGKLTLVGVSLLHNQSLGVNFEHGGGAVYNAPGSELTITKCTVDGNSGEHGGAVRSEYAKLNISDCTFSDNTGHQGGAFYSYVTSLVVERSTFTSNRSADSGGAAAIFSGSCNINNSSITGNQSGFSGGGMIIVNIDATISQTKICQNKAQVDGGGVFNVQSNTSFYDCTLDGNTCGQNGGGFMHQGREWLIGFYASQITNNIGITGGGGGVFLAGGQLEMNGCLVQNNENQTGGGVKLNTTSALTLIDDTEVIGNKSPGEGGGISFSYAEGGLVKNCLVKSNTAQYGAGVCASFSTADIENSVISQNAASNFGGGVALLNSSVVTCLESEIKVNTAPTGADVFVQEESTFTSTSSDIGVIFDGNP